MDNLIPYGKQSINEDDVNEVINVLKSDFLTQGPLINKFENNIAEKLGVKFAASSNSATSALHISCLALGIQENDIVWTSPNSFVASANCALYCGAKIDFVDISLETGLISIEKLAEKLEKAKKNNLLPSLLIPVHLTGGSCNMREIKKLSNEYGFRILEDASHALGSKYENKYVGSCEYSDICVFSFHPVKIITSGEGGIATTNDDLLAEKLFKYRTHGIEKNSDKFFLKTSKPWMYEQQLLGYNYRLTDIHAALGLSQLKRLDKFVLQRNEKFNNYKILLKDIEFIKFLNLEKNVYSSYHLAVIVLDEKINKLQEKIFNFLKESGIGVQIHYIPIHCQPYYSKLGFRRGDYPNAEKYANSVISIPLFPDLSEFEQKFVCEKIKEVINFSL